MRRYLARYCFSLAERYQIVDARHLPFEIEEEVYRVIKQWTAECVQEL